MSNLEQEKLKAAEQNLAEKREVLDDAQYDCQRAEEETEAARKALWAAGAVSLVGRCMRWKHDPDYAQVDAEKVISVDPAAGRAVVLQVSDAKQPGPFSPRVQLRSSPICDLFDHQENQETMAATDFRALLDAVVEKLSVAEGLSK